MNIVRKDLDPTNVVLTVQVEKSDYADKVEKTLRDYRKKANVPGFRPGMVPLALIQKMYGHTVLAEEVNKLLSDSLYNYIDENKIQVLGEPLPSENQTEIDFNTQQDFEFSFDLGIAPEFAVELSAKDKLPFYEIEVDKKMVEDAVQSYTSRFGRYEKIEAATAEDIVKSEIVELENGAVKEGGIKSESAVFSPKHLSSDAQQKLFIGKKVGDTVVFNPKKAFKDATEISNMLTIPKDVAAGIDADFQATILDITHYYESEINQELFDKVFGEGAVKSEAEFRDKIKENIATGLLQDSNYKFGIDAHDMLLKNYDNQPFPEAFLKRWIKTQEKDITDEKIETDYPLMLKDLTWTLIKNQILKVNDIKVEMADIEAEARQYSRAMFAQYGMQNVPEEYVEQQVKELIKKEDSVRQFANRASENKVVEFVKSKVKLETKKISLDNFNKMFEK